MPSDGTVLELSPKIRRRQSRTRETLLAESASLFVSNGFENVSVEDILGATGIARSSFYRFFRNREELLASIVRPVFKRGLRSLKDVDAEDGREIMVAIFKVFFDLFQTGPNAVRVSTRVGGVYFSLFEDVHREFRSELVRLVERAARSKILLNDNVDYTARLIARIAIPTLEVYSDHAESERLFMASMAGLLLKPEVNS